MCIIVYKPLDVKYPDKKVLRQCFETNPDGAGFMFASGGVVHINKGFMDFDSFYSALKAGRNKFGDAAPCVMHFRISTQAGVNKACCHPYPLSSKMSDLKKLTSICSIGVAHNGVIDLTTDYKQKDHNDTMTFITEYLSELIKNKTFYENKSILTMIYELARSKFAILDGDGHCELIGQFIEDNGVYYSNGSYVLPKKTKKKNARSNYTFVSVPCEPDNYTLEMDDFYNACPPDAYNCAYEDTGELCFCYLCQDREHCHTYLYYCDDYK